MGRRDNGPAMTYVILGHSTPISEHSHEAALAFIFGGVLFFVIGDPVLVSG